jgi:DNA-directed RNA polymerase subunit RPC12/RpoP
MAIQFRCAQCGHPIEVDDRHAGQTAACPYCRHVMNVPEQSTYRPDAAVPARPSDAGEPEGLTPLPAIQRPGPAFSPRQQNAQRFGRYAIRCVALALILYAIAATRGALLLRGSSGLWTATQPTPEQMSDFERQLRQVGLDPWVAIPQYGGLFFALAGLVLGIVSLTQGVSGNWRGLVAVIVCGLFFLCICASVAMMAMVGGRIPAG